MSIHRRLKQLEESLIADTERERVERMRRVMNALMSDADANAAAQRVARLELFGGSPEEIERARIEYQRHSRRLGLE